MSKYKLALIEPSDEMVYCIESKVGMLKGDIIYGYKAMTAECPTVELVDAEQIVNDFCKAYLKSKGMCFPSFTDYLTQNGYKIIKEIK